MSVVEYDAVSIRILFVNSNPFYKFDDRYYSTYSWVKFPELLSHNVSHVTLWAPVTELENSDSVPEGSFPVDTSRMDIVNSGSYQKFSQYVMALPGNYWHWFRLANELVSSHDVVVHRIPAPKLRLIVRAARKFKKPAFLMVAGDIRTQAEPLYSSKRWKRHLFAGITRFIQWRQIVAAKNAEQVYAYSGALRNKFGRGNRNTVISRTPHISRSSFFYRQDTCDDGRITLLRVCWLQHSKGIEDLLSTFAELCARGHDVCLRIVGEERTSGYRAHLEAMALKLGVQKEIEFVKWVPLDKMPAIYQSSDIHIVSSLAEGMPRCVVEAGANGLPQVVTAVGGCADVLTDGLDALLVPASDPKAMADAIERVISDGDLRRVLIKHGYKAAEKGTFEVEGRRILQDMLKAVSSNSDIDPNTSGA